MKRALPLIWLLLPFSFVFSENVRLSYSLGANSIIVDGFDLSRPYAIINGERQFLPLGGEWGIEIDDQMVFEEVYYPRSYKISRIRRSYHERNEPDLFYLRFDRDEIPVWNPESSEDPYAISWKKTDFEDAVVVLGWVKKDRFVAVNITLTDRPIPVETMDTVFGKFRISAKDADGYPVIMVLDKNSVELRKPIKKFSETTEDLLYRMACRGSARAFEGIQMSGKELSKVTVHNRLSLMHGAALYGNLEVLEYLHEIGADKIKRRVFDPVLLYAIYGGRVDAVRYLIEIGHNPLENFTSRLIGKALRKLVSSENSPYLQALRTGHLEIVDLLTEDVRYLEYRGTSGNAVDVAIIARDNDMFGLLLRKAKDNGLSIRPNYIFGKLASWYDITLTENCYLGNLDIVESLLEYKKLDLNKLSEVEATAVVSGNPSYRFVRGSSPLKAAVISGNPILVQSLINKGASLFTTYRTAEYTLLHEAAFADHISVIRVLLEAGMDINALDARGRTPLYLAVVSRNPEVVCGLLELGADTEIRPKGQPSAMWMAVVQDDRITFKSLIEFGANSKLSESLALQLMDYALSFEIPEMVETALDQHLSPDFLIDGAVPGVWLAEYYGSKACKEVLIKRGASPKASPVWPIVEADKSMLRLIAEKKSILQYPKELMVKYDDMRILIQFIVDPQGRIRFLDFLEPLPRDISLFVRNTLRNWTVDLPDKSGSELAYKVVFPLTLRSAVIDSEAY